MSEPSTPPPRKPLLQRLKKAWGLRAHIPRTFGILWRTSPAMAVAVLLITALQALAPAAMAWVGKLIVDAVVEASQAGGDVLQGRVSRLVLLELGLMAGSTLLGRLNNLLRELLRVQLGNHINVQILEKARTLELRHFEDSEFYDKMQRARREAAARPLNMILEILSIGQHALALGTFAILLVRLTPWAVLVLVAASIPAFIAEARLAGASFRLYTWRAPEGRRLNYLEWVLTRDSHIKDVKLFGLQDTLMERYRALYEKFYAEDRALAVKRFGYGLSLSLVSLLAFYACYGWMAQKASLSAITLGDLTLYVAVFRQGQTSFQTILSSVGRIYEDALFMSDLFTYLDIPSLGEQPRVLPPLQAAPGVQRLELRNVSFKYPNKPGWAIRDVNLTIEPGEVLALCGDNGAGKSTLIKLLMRLYDPTEGAILYGGVDLRDMDPEALRKRIGVVFQDFVRYQFTFAENIGLGWVPALEDQSRIELAALAGGADAIVSELPKKYDTMLGGWFEAGHELSTGQWQKVATARAFMRDAELLILDEPTASLDAEAEYDMFQRFRKLAAGKSAILISHRFSTVRMADRIVVLKSGQIEELGTHAELLAKNGRYAHLFRLQAAGYVD
ncbi:MAG: ABC transporter ATP-binding protein [Myxococcales bacterium]